MPSMMLLCIFPFLLISEVTSFHSIPATSRVRSPLPHSLHLNSATGLDLGKASPSQELIDYSTIEDDKFHWDANWYPLVPTEFLDPSKPHKYTLLGLDIVVWNDSSESDEFESKTKSKKKRSLKNLFRKNKNKNNGQWRAFADRCPHRLVPLSEGRVESDGSLLCSYHGWRFDGEGTCVGLPQSTQSQFEKLKENPRSQCNSFPVKIVNDVLWVWPDSGPDAKLQSELTPLSVLPPIVDENGKLVPEENIIYNTYNFRELPYGADYFLENVVDPAHVPVSHHNIVGDRYTDPKPINLKTKESMTKNGFVLNQVGDNGEVISRVEFKSPCLVVLDTKVDGNGARQMLELYVSPSRPGFSNHLGRIVLVKDKEGNIPSFLKQFTIPLPVWLNHLLAGTFLNQDALFLHGQERNLHRDANYKTSLNFDDNETADKNPLYKEIVYTPTSSDKGVIMFRDWLRLKAGGKIPFRGYQGMPPVDNEVVFDQWHSHTTKCQYCMGAYKKARKIRVATAALAILLVACRPGGAVKTSLSVGLLSGISFASHKIIKALRRIEFSHAEND